MKDKILGHLKDYQRVEAELQASLAQARGAMWYIQTVLLPTIDISVQAEGDTESPPRTEHVE